MISGAVVVTGASSGIGEACALRLDELGFQVFAGVRREAAGLALQSKASKRLVPVLLDVTNAESIAAAVETIQSATGGVLHGLVNNAGIVIAGPLEYVPVEEVRRQMEINVVGQVAVTQAVLPLLRQGPGRIVNIGSISGLCALPFAGAYAASKFALEEVSDSLRVELRPWGISVSIVEPGNVETPIWQKGLAAADEMLGEAPEPGATENRKLYGPAIEFLRRRAQNPRGVEPEQVALVVARAVTARKPGARYAVGRDTHALRLLRVLPTPIRDRLIESQLPRYGR